MKSSSQTRVLVALSCFASIAGAQKPVKALSFDVAVIKRATQLPQAMSDHSLIGLKIGPGQVSIGHAPLAALIQLAYGVKRNQLEGPDWLLDVPDLEDFSHPFVAKDYDLFDIEAKLPQGADVKDIPAMLQVLLAERFHLKVRHGKRETNTFALLVGKRGPVFREKQVDLSGLVAPSVEVTNGRTQNPAVIRLGETKVTVLPDGGTRVEMSTIQQLVDYLTLQAHVPVVDKTKLPGRYDIQMVVRPEEGERTGAVSAAGVAERSLNPIFTAVAKLGLKMERQKNSVETIVVVSADRAPTEN